MCLEMVGVALAHDYAYSEREFIQQGATKNNKMSTLKKLGNALSLTDTAKDVYSTFKKVQ